MNGNSNDAEGSPPATAIRTAQLPTAASGTQEDHMPPDPAPSPGTGSPGTRDPAIASSGSEPADERDAGSTTRHAEAPGSQSGDEDPLLGELDCVLTAIIERRRTTVPRATADDDFADIRSAFSLLRNALWAAATDNSDPGSVRIPAAGTPDPAESAQAAVVQNGHATGTSDFDDIRAAFADLRRVLELPAHGRHARGGGPHPGVLNDLTASKLLDQAAAEAQACARRYRDTPEWQRIAKIGRATRELIAAIREAAGAYWAELRQDVRVRGFVRTLAARVSLAVSGTAGLLASRLELAGKHDTRAWQAASALHRATSTFADRIMRYTSSSPSPPDRMNDVRNIIDELGRQLGKVGEPPSRASSVTSRQPADTPSAVALATTSFPASVSQGMTRMPTASVHHAASPIRDRRTAPCWRSAT